MLFHNARSIGLMPLFTAMRYIVSPRCTRTVAPGLPVELAARVLEEDVSFTTVLLHATSEQASNKPIAMRIMLSIIRMPPRATAIDCSTSFAMKVFNTPRCGWDTER